VLLYLFVVLRGDGDCVHYLWTGVAGSLGMQLERPFAGSVLDWRSYRSW
jgi:hypothetical protein